MKGLVFTKKAKRAYMAAVLLCLTAGALELSGWSWVSGVAGGAAIGLALSTASANGHLTKRAENDTHDV